MTQRPYASSLLALLFALATSAEALADPAPPPSIPELSIVVAAKDLGRLRTHREDDQARSAAVATRDGYAKAVVETEGRRVEAKVRLEGAYPEPGEKRKWPLKVKVGGDGHVFGMRRLLLRPPADGGYQAEPLMLAHLRREGVLAPRYRFARVSLSGENMGLMAIEELPSLELLESQARREGVMARLKPARGAWGKKEVPDAGQLFDALFLARLDPFRDGRVKKVASLASGLETAGSLLRGFLRGELPAEEVFALEPTARFLALAELWDAPRMLDWRNLRLYFDPVTQRLEPLAHAGAVRTRPGEAGLATRSEAWGLVLLESPRLRAGFVSELRRIAASFANEPPGAEIENDLADYQAALRQEYPARAAFDLGPLTRRARKLAAITQERWASAGPRLAETGSSYPRAVRAIHHRTARGDALEVLNHLEQPMKLDSLLLAVPGSDSGVEIEPDSPGPLPLQLDRISEQGTPRPLRLDFTPPAAAEHTFRLTGLVRGAEGAEHAIGFRVIPAAPAALRSAVPTATREEALAQHPFLSWDESAQALRAKTGTWAVAGSLVLPEGTGLQLDPGTTLRFGRDAMLLASGPLHFLGTPEMPVVLEGIPGATGTGSWQGLACLRSAAPHRWRSVEVHDTTGVRRGPWRLDAGVTLRASELDMRATTIRGNRSEDALNLIHSRFALRDISILNTPSDAVDADFSDGVVEGGVFRDVGGDGIDVSGAEVEIAGTRLENVHDKAISVGEQSRLSARRVQVRQAGTAVASKDGSIATVEDSTFAEIRHTALMAYVKKPEYGPARLIANRVQMEKVGRPAAAQLGSELRIDGVVQQPEPLDVQSFYEGGHMEK